MNANSHKASQRPARAPRRIFLFLSLCLLGLTLAYAAEPPEVEKLKGMYIPPITRWKTPGGIPEWKQVWGGIFLDPVRESEPDLSVDVITRGPLAAFAIVKIYPDKGQTVLDARAIPIKHVYHLTEFCEREPSPKEATIMALAYPEKCQEETRRIIRAWQVDHRTGLIADISMEGVVCCFPGAGVDNPQCEVVGDSN